VAALQISYKDPRQLRPRARNPRTHTPKQIKQIAASIKEFGFISPVLAAPCARAVGACGDRGGGGQKFTGRAELDPPTQMCSVFHAVIPVEPRPRAAQLVSATVLISEFSDRYL
jgi:hypothetical protein